VTWLRLDDGFAHHKKVAPLSDRAFRLHVTAMLHCADQLTDGFVGEAIPLCLTKAPQGKALVSALHELVSAGLWEPVAGGWLIHDFADWNPSAAEVKEKRNIAQRRSLLRANQGLMRQIKERDGDACRYCGCKVSWVDRKGPTGGTYDHVTPISTGGSDGPDNVVVACRGCNSIKRDRTPEQAGIVLLPEPNRKITRLLPVGAR